MKACAVNKFGVAYNRVLVAGVLSFTLVSGSGILNGTSLSAFSIVPGVQADENGEGGKGAGYKGPRDSQGKRGSDRPTDSVPGKGQGQGGPDPSSDAKGPRFGGGGATPDDGERGGRPAWAQEGIPEGVELGRLNVARSPDHVLERALNETITTWNPAYESLYEMSAEDAAALLESDYDNVLRVDSPLANLAFYQQLLIDGTTQLPNVTAYSTNDLAAILLGGASDKVLPITEGTVEAINLILGVEMTPADVSAIATDAESVRQAIEIGHD